MLRGINKQNIFEEDEDCEDFLNVLRVCKALSGFKLYAYCLMGNHIHLLIKAGQEPIEQIFKRIGARFVFRYNQKYGRVGHLFQDRYKSEPIEGEHYLIGVLRYIHQNPVQANIQKTVAGYPWSSYGEYVGTGMAGFVDTGEILSIFGENKENAVTRFKSLMSEQTGDVFLDDSGSTRLSEKELRAIIKRECGTDNVAEFQTLPATQRDANIRKLRSAGLSIRQISRLTGVSFQIVRCKGEQHG
jgi:REP element-mobilizing transposase RayT